MKDWIVITGPTASGKTKLAVAVAHEINGEIVSADSRQVYKRLDIGTGKDLEEYQIEGHPVPYHMIDIVEPGSEYHISRFQSDALEAISEIEARGKRPVLCGGSGLYLEVLLEGSDFIHVPIDKELRDELIQKTKEELIGIFESGRNLSYDVDRNSKKRLIRAIEIQKYIAPQKDGHHTPNQTMPECPIFLTYPDRDTRRSRISKRLKARLEGGLIEEVAGLRETISDDWLVRLGLEYKLVTLYLQGTLSREEMIVSLETSIHQFAKRQMTWFRRMERKGYRIIPIPDDIQFAEKVDIVLKNTDY